MALTFPLTLAQYFDRFTRFEATPPVLGAAVTENETGGGESITSRRGARLYRGRVSVQSNAFRDHGLLKTRTELLLQEGASFLIRHPYRRGPAADPNGTLLGAATPQITSVNANNRDVTISGLPAGYKLTEDDLVAWTYLSSPTRYALHTIVSTATANSSGVISGVEIMPPIRVGYVLPLAITLYNPVCKARILTKSYRPPSVRSDGTTLVSFDWQQTLK